ncbi:hypothetical protein MATL_G00138100 [Megalops atlanticus]|uniref:Uncharacterized protein n=1 Tax=Megalops atlanticus TaxID=7932 RepID=A0A9D3PVZ6_MEGAT|nr:hypothetical protein MATL_G00138100 [Megalops atlanticus]
MANFSRKRVRREINFHINSFVFQHQRTDLYNEDVLSVELSVYPIHTADALWFCLLWWKGADNSTGGKPLG